MATEHKGDRWFAYHHATREEHKQHWDERTSTGWYCMSLSRSNTTADPCFAAVWIWPEKPLAKQDQAHLDFIEVVAHLNGLPEGKIPTIITACCGLDELPRFTVVSEKGTGAFLAKADMTEIEFLSQCTTSRANGKILRWAAAFPVPLKLQVNYAAIWTGNPDQVAWKCTEAMDGDDFQAEFDANDNGWVRPSVLIPTVASPLVPNNLLPVSPWKRQLMAGWSDALVRMSLTFVDIDDDELADLIDKHKAKGLLPTHIQSFGIGKEMRYGLIIGSPEDVIDRGSLVFDGNPPPLPSPNTRYLGRSRKFSRHPDSYSVSPRITRALDAAVQKDMESTGHRATQLAVAHNGDLVFAAGYTFGEEGLYPLTTPTDVFRVGSLSKVITAIAIHQLDEKTPSTDKLLEKFIAPLLGLTFKDKFGEEIKVRHLLAHTGGIPKNAGVKLLDGSLLANDKMEYDKEVNNGKFPVSKDMVFKFVAGLKGFVRAKPGGPPSYSNTGYDFLGEVISKTTGGTIMDHVQKHIFKPLGIRIDVKSKSPRWAESERLKEQDGEVRYHDSDLDTTITVASDSGELVPACYGVWNMARVHASSSWVISAPHYLRILSRFKIPGDNPLFSEPDTEKEFTRADNPHGGLVDSNGKTWSKNGAAPGARAMCFFTDDGWSMVYLANSGSGTATNDAATKFGVLQGWLDPTWNSIATDANAWRKMDITL
jgi:CubicO group peptidase (beta-lactamase class C family)